MKFSAHLHTSVFVENETENRLRENYTNGTFHANYHRAFFVQKPFFDESASGIPPSNFEKIKI